MSLTLDRVTKRYGERVALDELTLEIPSGEVVGLLGPNGSGKTTAMRSVFGVIDPDEGRILYEGAPIDAVVRRRFGYMPEERGLYPDMRVLDQVVYFGRLFGLDAEAARHRALELLERLGLSERTGEKLEALSLGNQQRVQLAVALVHEPEALVLDEPFSGLDPLAVDDLSSIIRGAATQGRTVLFSSHQLDLVEDLCDSVRVIDGGRLVLAGRVADLKQRSGRRQLRIRVDGVAAESWAAGLPGAEIRGEGLDGVRLGLAPEAEPLAILDAARAAGEVSDFALELPPLSELFLEAVGEAAR